MIYKKRILLVGFSRIMIKLIISIMSNINSSFKVQVQGVAIIKDDVRLTLIAN